jgi:hypothetical protein
MNEFMLNKKEAEVVTHKILRPKFYDIRFAWHIFMDPRRICDGGPKVRGSIPLPVVGDVMGGARSRNKVMERNK